MADFRFSHQWVGVSSNNIYWEKTSCPVQLIQVSLDSRFEHYATIANPTLTYLTSRLETSLEGCGSVVGPQFNIHRPRQLEVSGYLLEEGRYATLKPARGMPAHILEHEVEHLEGKLIADSGIVDSIVLKKDDSKLAALSLYLPPEGLPEPLLSAYSANLTLKKFSRRYRPRGHLQLSLSVRKGDYSWDLHTVDCPNSISLGPKSLSMIFPDTKISRTLLLELYSEIPTLMEQDSFAALPIHVCGCIGSQNPKSL
jgi:peptide deformylase